MFKTKEIQKKWGIMGAINEETSWAFSLESLSMLFNRSSWNHFNLCLKEKIYQILEQWWHLCHQVSYLGFWILVLYMTSHDFILSQCTNDKSSWKRLMKHLFQSNVLEMLIKNRSKAFKVSHISCIPKLNLNLLFISWS